MVTYRLNCFSNLIKGRAKPRPLGWEYQSKNYKLSILEFVELQICCGEFPAISGEEDAILNLISIKDGFLINFVSWNAATQRIPIQ